MLQFQPGYLGALISDLQEKSFCGVAHVDIESDSNRPKNDRLLVFHNGEITYGGADIPDPNSLSQVLAKHFNLPLMDDALQLAKKKLGEQVSIR